MTSRSIEDQESIKCDDCEITFKSEYHLENHVKGSQHQIKSGLNRKFSYKLNQKNAQKKFLRGAEKNPFLKEHKSTCAVLNFNDGSYFHSVLPLIEDWKRVSGDVVQFDDLDIHVNEVKDGKEENGMCIDVLIKFEMNEKKVVVHCYNTKQKILVNGAGYMQFTEKYLEPILKKTIENKMIEIQSYNRLENVKWKVKVCKTSQVTLKMIIT